MRKVEDSNVAQHSGIITRKSFHALSLPASINRLSACENGNVLDFFKADALPSEGEIVVLMGIKSD